MTVARYCKTMDLSINVHYMMMDEAHLNIAWQTGEAIKHTSNSPESAISVLRSVTSGEQYYYLGMMPFNRGSWIRGPSMV